MAACGYDCCDFLKRDAAVAVITSVAQRGKMQIVYGFCGYIIHGLVSGFEKVRVFGLTLFAKSYR